MAPSVRHVRPAGRSGAVVGPRLTVSAARAADEELVIEGAIARALVIGVLQRSLELLPRFRLSKGAPKNHLAPGSTAA